MSSKPTMKERYDLVVGFMIDRYQLEIHQWRSSTTGCAWVVKRDDGSLCRYVEAPYPKGPMSAAVFLHEVGHHAIGLGVYRPRCLEEFKAWEWSLSAMQQFNLNITPAVERRVHDSLHYALQKALRRGLKNIPEELVPFATPSVRSAPVRKAAHVARKSGSRSSTRSKRVKKAKKRILWIFPKR